MVVCEIANIIKSVADLFFFIIISHSINVFIRVFDQKRINPTQLRIIRQSYDIKYDIIAFRYIT